MPEFVDKTGVIKTEGSCCGAGDSNKDPDPTINIENCYHCINASCGCSNDSGYKEDLIKMITEEVLKE